jgi:hypothetical protein
MSNFTLIHLIADSVKINEAMTLTRDVVDGPWDLNTSWIVAHHWAVVPVESASHFDESDAEHLSNACSQIGCRECLAIATEPLENTVLRYTVETTKEGFLEFSRETTALNYVLLPVGRSFAILCTSEDYYLVAGPPDFITTAVGSSIEAARVRFLQFADDQLWPVSERKRLLAVAEKYSHYNGLGSD